MELIKYGDSLRQGTDKLNVAITHASEAKEISEQAIQIANTATENADEAALTANQAAENANTAAELANGEAANLNELKEQAADATVYANTAASNAQRVADENKIHFLYPVATIAERDATYPNPQHGDTVRITSLLSSYRFVDGTGWIKTDEYDPTAIDEMSDKLNKYSIIRQDTPPEGIIEGRLWLDTSDESFQGTMFEELEHELNEVNTRLEEVFQSGNNVKSDTVSALLSVDSSLPIDDSKTWTEIITSITQIKTGQVLTPGDFIIASSDMEMWADGDGYVPMKEIKVNASGRIKVSFSLRAGSLEMVYGRIYVNRVAVGLERQTAKSIYTTFIEDIDVSNGDVVEIFARSTSNGKLVYVSNFRLSIAPLANVII